MSTITIHCDLPDRGARVNRHFGDTATVCVPYYPNRTLEMFLESIEIASAENGGQHWGDDPVYIVDELQLFCHVDDTTNTRMRWNTYHHASRRLRYLGIQADDAYVLRYAPRPSSPTYDPPRDSAHDGPVRML